MALEIICEPGISQVDIRKVFNSELELAVNPGKDLAATIVEILMGTRQTREGSRPGIPYQYDMLGKIEQCIVNGFAIRVTIPAGPKKPGMETNVDLAEYWFLRILHEMATKVKAIYSPGILFSIMLEDASMAIFEPDMPSMLAVQYHQNLQSLINVLGYANEISLVSELAQNSVYQLQTVGDTIVNEMDNYLEALLAGDVQRSHDAMGKVWAKGWMGHISNETLDHYVHTFTTNYPGESMQKTRQRISVYLSISFARYILNTRRITSYSINMANAKRVPGVEFKQYDRVFLRTMPLSRTKTHIPFWRARGILVREAGEYSSKLFPFNQPLDTEVTRVTLENEQGLRAVIRLEILDNTVEY